MRRTIVAAALAFACAKPEHFATVVRDDLGRAVAMPSPVTRVVTLAPNLTEIVFAIGAGSKIVATDNFSDTPAQAKSLPKVGGVPPDVERIAAVHPDLVLAISSGGNAQIAGALRSVGVPLFVVRTDRMADVPRVMDSLGTTLDAPAARRASAELRRAIERQRRQRRKPPRVVFAIWTDPLYVAGRDTFGDDLLALTGAHNAVESRGWPQYSLEALVANPPDLILYPNKSVTPAAIEALFRAAPELRRHTAAVAVDENSFTRPGPRLAGAAAELNGILDRWPAGRR